MFILHVDLSVKPGMAGALEETYRNVFHPAISQQEGFSQTRLLRPGAKEKNGYRLVIGFHSEEFQRKWVATDLHQEVWPRIEANITEYSVNRFESV